MNVSSGRFLEQAVTLAPRLRHRHLSHSPKRGPYSHRAGSVTESRFSEALAVVLREVGPPCARGERVIAYIIVSRSPA
jgi:hypothetical protein